VLLIIGALTTHPGSQNPFLNRMPAVLWILAIGSYWTFAHRMYHTWREVNKADALKTATAANAGAASNTGSERRPEPDFARNAGATR
jgi:CDP-diacylglycerol--glycerol-3-phosphate 3-phosphatidyltransferase